MPNREDAYKLLKEYTNSDSLIKHALAVEAAMIACAKKYNEDEAKYAVTGLLHDFDYEKYPDNHPQEGKKILEEKGYDAEIIEAIQGHNDETGISRESQLAKCLYAVDELAGFITACAYVRPTNLEGMKPKSVKKNLKKKGFAAKVDRSIIKQGIEELGADENEHIMMIIEAMQEISQELGF
ncbi:MAG: HD domain-containing protein [bacterium]